jgi:hypothetical protein
MLDPEFPNRLLKSSPERVVEFIQFLLEDYSKRSLTKKTDRSVAISGLVSRITSVLPHRSRHGVFEQYLHRNLLWQASDSRMEKLEYETQLVPSWSWMAYNGGIQFMSIAFGTVDWNKNLRFDTEIDHALVTDVGNFQACTLKQEEMHHAILDLSGIQRGWVKYDIGSGGDICKEQCVVIGRKSNDLENEKEYYMLVVRPTSVDREYNRAGVGLIQSGFVLRQRLEVRIV